MSGSRCLKSSVLAPYRGWIFRPGGLLGVGGGEGLGVASGRFCDASGGFQRRVRRACLFRLTTVGRRCQVLSCPGEQSCGPRMRRLERVETRLVAHSGSAELIVEGI